MMEMFKTASEREQLMLTCFVYTMGKKTELELERAKIEAEGVRQETERIRLQAIKADIELEKMRAQANKQKEAAGKGAEHPLLMNNNGGRGGWQPVPQGFGGHGSGSGMAGYRPGDYNDYGDYGGEHMRGDSSRGYSLAGGMGNYGGGQMTDGGYGGMRGGSNDAYGPSAGGSWEVGNGAQGGGMAMAPW
ncbi:hypothetical protein D9613_009222 [Agrocybe pediades]|uniref:Uncharacterized protein n=1 Tax=Agrocybe pediades TaxID=84607 RepID=A0A8H4VVW2_9AGAR|nr:hypothetical protein D9613_009222 [Agrocybe pediades]